MSIAIDTTLSRVEQARILARRVRFHWFLIGGSQPNGYVDGKMTYTEPIDPSEHVHCLWHGEHCQAWAEIKKSEAIVEVKMNGLTLAELQDDRRTLITVRETSGDQPGDKALAALVEVMLKDAEGAES